MFSGARVVAVFVAAAMLWSGPAERDRARRLYERRDFRGAAALLEAHLKESPADRDSRILLGLCRRQLGEDGEAEQVFREAIRTSPKDGQAFFYLALSEHFQGKFLDAEADARQAIRMGAKPAPSLHLIGRTREEQNRVEEAIRYYLESQSADPAYVEARISAGQAYLKLSQFDSAIEHLQKARELNPTSAEAAFELGRAYLAAGRTKESDELFKTAVDLGHKEAARLRKRVAPAANPGSRPQAEPDPVQFRDVAAQSGIGFVLHHHPTPEKNLIETMAGGVAAFDYNNDGRTDIFFTNGAETPSLTKTGPSYFNRLFRNDGNMKFTDVTTQTAVEGIGFSIGAAAADYDNDGHADLFVAGYPHNVLYRNLNGAGFADVTRKAGIRSGEWSITGGWFDYDNDGWLDLFVVNYVAWSPEKNRYCGEPTVKVRTYCHPKFFGGTANRLYRNNRDGTFEDVSVKSGIAAHRGKGMSVAFADYDLDGWTDVFVTNDAIPNYLFRNKGDGTFEERAMEAGPALNDHGTAVSAMGVDFRDYNNDGLPDLIFTALAGETFPLFRNVGGGMFHDRTYADRIGLLSARRSGWNVNLADFNNDGWKDVFTANSHVTDNVDLFSAIDKYLQPNSLWLNRGDGSFTEGTPFSHPRAHRGGAVADFDSDGRLDVVVSSLGGQPELWQNTTSSPNHWIRFHLQGNQSNRDGIGAVIRVGRQVNVMATNSGYASGSRAGVHFGLGRDASPVQAEIYWPSGVRQRLDNLPPDRLIVVEEK